MSIGARIREVRRQKSIGQREMARRLGMDSGSYNKIEMGKIKSPRFETMVKIAEALDVSVGAFMPEQESNRAGL